MRRPIYTNEVEYIQTKTEIADQIAAIEEVRTALLAQALTMATGKPISEYFLNDGHTTIKRVYHSPEQIMAVRKMLLSEANELRKRLTGRTSISVPGKHLR